MEKAVRAAHKSTAGLIHQTTMNQSTMSLAENTPNAQNSKKASLLLDYENDDDDLVSVDLNDDVLEYHDNAGSYLNVEADHMKSISKVHIKINLASQIIGILAVMLAYGLTGIIKMNDPGSENCPWPENFVSKILPMFILAPNKQYYFFMAFRNNVSCNEANFCDPSQCDIVSRTTFTNIFLNVMLLLGVIMLFFSILW